MARDDHDPIPDVAGEYWDALVRGEPLPTHLAPALGDTIRRVHALDDARGPDPAFVTRLERVIMATMGVADWLAPVTPTPLLWSAPNGRAETAPTAALLPQPNRLQRWTPPFAAAALVLLTLIGSYVALGGALRIGRLQEAPVFLPALGGTPEVSLPPGVSADTELFRQTLHEIPADVGWAGSGRVTVAPGTEWLQGTMKTTGVGPMLYRIETGALMAQADGPMAVTPVGATTPTQVPARDAILLSPGDSVFIASGVASRWRNDGPSPAVVLEAGLTTFATFDLPPGVSYDALSVGLTLTTMPIAPAELTLQRMTLEAGARLPIQPQPGLDALGVESGRIQIVLKSITDRTKQTDPRLMLAGNWLDLNAQVYDTKGQRYLPREIRNDGTDAATLVLLTVTPLAGQAGTPTS